MSNCSLELLYPVLSYDQCMFDLSLIWLDVKVKYCCYQRQKNITTPLEIGVKALLKTADQQKNPPFLGSKNKFDFAAIPQGHLFSHKKKKRTAIVFFSAVGEKNIVLFPENLFANYIFPPVPQTWQGHIRSPKPHACIANSPPAGLCLPPEEITLHCRCMLPACFYMFCIHQRRFSQKVS